MDKIIDSNGVEWWFDEDQYLVWKGTAENIRKTSKNLNTKPNRNSEN